jgi:hypothetical protein
VQLVAAAAIIQDSKICKLKRQVIHQQFDYQFLTEYFMQIDYAAEKLPERRM